MPRYFASASEDAEFAAWHAAALIGVETAGPVCLVQCGGPSPAASAVAKQLGRFGRRTLSLMVDDRAVAKSDRALSTLAASTAVWVFADSMLATFLTSFATPMAFALRARTREGLPVIGFGGGALSLGGLVLARRVCSRTTYDLASGLGWAPRVLIDADMSIETEIGALAAATVQALPQLLAVRLGASGAVRVEGGRVTSVGSESAVLLGMDPGMSTLRALSIRPGSTVTIAPPPFAPFERSVLPFETSEALGQAHTSQAEPIRRSIQQARPSPLRHAPPPPESPETPPEPASPNGDVLAGHQSSGVGRSCPLCNHPHEAGDFVQAAA